MIFFNQYTYLLFFRGRDALGTKKNPQPYSNIYEYLISEQGKEKSWPKKKKIRDNAKKSFSCKKYFIDKKRRLCQKIEI